MIIEISSGCELKSHFVRLKKEDLTTFGILTSNGWLPDWEEPFWNDCMVYGLFLDDFPNIVQGLVAFCIAESSLEVFKVEAAIHNKRGNPHRLYKRVGKHMIAYGCKLSIMMKRNYPTRGFLSAYIKSNARGFYEAIGAESIFYDWWMIDPWVGRKLINECFFGGESNENEMVNERIE